MKKLLFTFALTILSFTANAQVYHDATAFEDIYDGKSMLNGRVLKECTLHYEFFGGLLSSLLNESKTYKFSRNGQLLNAEELDITDIQRDSEGYIISYKIDTDIYTLQYESIPTKAGVNFKRLKSKSWISNFFGETKCEYRYKYKDVELDKDKFLSDDYEERHLYKDGKLDKKEKREIRFKDIKSNIRYSYLFPASEANLTAENVTEKITQEMTYWDNSSSTSSSPSSNTSGIAAHNYNPKDLIEHPLGLKTVSYYSKLDDVANAVKNEKPQWRLVTRNEGAIFYDTDIAFNGKKAEHVYFQEEIGMGYVFLFDKSSKDAKEESLKFTELLVKELNKQGYGLDKSDVPDETYLLWMKDPNYIPVLISCKDVDQRGDSFFGYKDCYDVSIHFIIGLLNVPPVFRGDINKYLAENLKYPKDAQMNGVEGKVIVEFTITTDGSIRNVKLVNKVNPLLDAEAVRVIESMPNWHSAIKDGRSVPESVTLPIVFALPNNDDKKD